MPGELLGYHFLRADRRLQFAPHTPVEVGQTLTVDAPLKLCKTGLHASVRAIDALNYAPGPVVCRVRLSGNILQPDGEDKLCASERTVTAMADATTVLHEFACWAAESALLAERAAGREPDARSWAAIEAKRAWLRGELDDVQLDAARAAARDASWAAAWDASWAAARAASWAASWAAARAAASAAAGAAAGAAAWDAAWAAARDAAGAAAWDASWDAAWDAASAAAGAAARAAARAAFNTELERRLNAMLLGA